MDLTSSSSICAFRLDNLEETETMVEVVETLGVGGGGIGGKGRLAAFFISS